MTAALLFLVLPLAAAVALALGGPSPALWWFSLAVATVNVLVAALSVTPAARATQALRPVMVVTPAHVNGSILTAALQALHVGFLGNWAPRLTALVAFSYLVLWASTSLVRGPQAEPGPADA